MGRSFQKELSIFPMAGMSLQLQWSKTPVCPDHCELGRVYHITTCQGLHSTLTCPEQGRSEVPKVEWGKTRTGSKGPF